jgi:hypothetical protein
LGSSLPSSLGTGPWKIKLVNGKVVQYDSTNTDVWDAGTSRGSGYNHLTLEEDGKLQLYDNYTNSVIWCSDTGSYDYENTYVSIMRSGESLVSSDGNQYLDSCDGTYYAEMGGDGNFAVYLAASSTMVWSTNTSGDGTGPYQMKLTYDGNLVLTDSNGMVTWTTNTINLGVSPYSLKLENNGNLKIIDKNWTTILANWFSRFSTFLDILVFTNFENFRIKTNPTIY